MTKKCNRLGVVQQSEGPPCLPGTLRVVEGLLPECLPTSRLNVRGRPTGALRDELYSIPNWRNALSVVGVWVQSVGVIIAAIWIGHPVAWVAAFLLMGRASVMFAILAHEAAHRLLFSNRRVNDVVGTWLLGAPMFVPLEAYRRGHMAHHKEEFGPNEPDLQLYAGYPISRASWRRKLIRDAVGISGWKNLKLLFVALSKSSSRPVALKIVIVQIAMALAWTLAGYPLVWPLLWFLPWMTMWRVLNRLRAVAEHGGLQASPDRRLTTHHVRQSPSARFWMVPYRTGWHLAHHVDIGVPFRHLPRLQKELERAGWVVPELAYPSYRALWRAALQRESSAAPTASSA